jgi:hypothetical protein
MRRQSRRGDAFAGAIRFRPAIVNPLEFSTVFALFLRIEAEPLFPLAIRRRQIRLVALHRRENQSPRPGRRRLELCL